MTAPNPYFAPTVDDARAGRVIEGASRHEAATAVDGREWTWRDRDGDEGRVLAGYGAVGLDLWMTSDDFEIDEASHVLDPDAAELLAARLCAAAAISRKLTRG